MQHILINVTFSKFVMVVWDIVILSEQFVVYLQLGLEDNTWMAVPWNNSLTV